MKGLEVFLNKICWHLGQKKPLYSIELQNPKYLWSPGTEQLSQLTGQVDRFK